MMNQFLIGFNVNDILAQGEIDSQEKIFYRNEKVFGVSLNSNGYGLSYRYATRVNAYKHNLFEFEFAEIKLSSSNPATLAFLSSRAKYFSAFFIRFSAKRVFKSTSPSGV